MILSWRVLIYGPITGLAQIGIATAAGQHLFLVAIVGALLLGYQLASRVAAVAWQDLGQDLRHDWRTKVYAHVQRAQLGYLEGERATRLAGVMSTDIDQLGGFLSGPMGDLLQLLGTFVVLVLVYSAAASNLVWVAFLCVPVIVWMSFGYEEKATGEYGDRSDAGARLTSELINNMEASTTIKEPRDRGL